MATLDRELTLQEIADSLPLAFQKMYAHIDEAIAKGKAKKLERKPPTLCLHNSFYYFSKNYL